MYAQRLTQRHVVAACRVVSRTQRFRRLATAPTPPEAPQPTPSSKLYQYGKAEPERSWVVQRIRANPIAFKIVRALGRALGYGSTKQVAGRRTLAMYEQVCAVKASEDRAFWQEGGPLPSIFGLLHCGLTPGYLSLRFTPNIPILVHHYQPPHLATNRSATRTAAAPRYEPHPKPNRPLLLGCRRPNQGRSPTHRLRSPTSNRLLRASIYLRPRLHLSCPEETRSGTRQARQTTDADHEGTVGRPWDVTRPWPCHGRRRDGRSRVEKLPWCPGCSGYSLRCLTRLPTVDQPTYWREDVHGQTQALGAGFRV